MASEHLEQLRYLAQGPRMRAVVGLEAVAALRWAIRRCEAMEGVITHPSGNCQHEDCCDQPATAIACGKDLDGKGHPKPGCYCLTHARLVADEGNPEYSESCPNCGCLFG